MDYEKKYNEALNWMRELYPGLHGATKEDAEHYFPELRESEDEKARKIIASVFSEAGDRYIQKSERDIVLSYLEKQKEHWTPSKEVMDVLYALAYITNEVDDHKDDVITRLYQDLKREFFNGASYENMFPKEDEQKEQKSVIGLKFRVGDTIHKKGENTILPRTIERIEDGYYIYDNDKGFINIKFQDDYELVEQKQEWSEEDEMIRNAILGFLNPDKGGTKYSSNAELVEWSNWLKSLRPQSHWKPSEEQESVAERFARIVRANLSKIDKEVQQEFEHLYFEITGNKMYGGYHD